MCAGAEEVFNMRHVRLGGGLVEESLLVIVVFGINSTRNAINSTLLRLVLLRLNYFCAINPEYHG